MKQSPEMTSAQHRMVPGIITIDGFLGSDGRALADIIDTDAATLNRLGYTTEAIVAQMRALRDIGKRGMGIPVSAPPHFDVEVDAVRGHLPCPFGERGLYGKTITRVTNRMLNEQIQFSDLQVHMIGRHGFFEGKGSTYRLDPERVVRVLEIPNNKNEVSPW